MSTIFGLAGLTASDYQFALQANQELLYTAIQEYAMQANMARLASASLFVQSAQTSKVAERYQLPMTGMMQRRNRDGRGDSVRRTGKIDVAFPLEDFTDSLDMDDVSMSYMPPAEFEAHIVGINTRADNTYRHEILRRIFRNSNDSFVDPQNGTITSRALANGSTDSQLYPPVIGSDSEATQDHYLASGYVASAISATNNPVKTAAQRLIARYGRTTGGIDIATLINAAQVDQLAALPGFVEYTPNQVMPGNDTDGVLDNARIPGQIIGYLSGSTVAVWDWIPANYLFSTYLNAPAPLVERIDPPETGLRPGLTLVEDGRERFPHSLNAWRYRFGIGVRNRLNGVVTELTAGSYSIPTAYA